MSQLPAIVNRMRINPDTAYQQRFLSLWFVGGLCYWNGTLKGKLQDWKYDDLKYGLSSQQPKVSLLASH